MSILDYFAVTSSKSFPNLRGELSNRIPSAKIELANQEVCVVLNEKLPESANFSKGKKPQVYSSKEQAKLGKLAVDTY